MVPLGNIKDVLLFICMKIIYHGFCKPGKSSTLWNNYVILPIYNSHIFIFRMTMKSDLVFLFYSSSTSSSLFEAVSTIGRGKNLLINARYSLFSKIIAFDFELFTRYVLGTITKQITPIKACNPRVMLFSWPKNVLINPKRYAHHSANQAKIVMCILRRKI